ncbi:MAG: acyl-ACP--UDP-N-acetylglucosamine O-acyltransferase [Planctomycetaceae bacterium]|jgi:UDP-N-acetylglucosamine acyltransferase|nr:acyl-ACP--UDP-N-acetylglucosamine O-acyltransferase [Planctomycetaceae bacterium]
MSINPHAIVHSFAKIGVNVEIGAFCVIESDVVIGDGCRLDSNVTIKQGVVIGKENHFCTGTVIGGRPQHTAVKGDCGKIYIGDNNIFRENVTVHRAIKEPDATTIGNNNYLMVNAHVAHNCKVGNDNVLVNNVMLGGHVQVGNRVNLGGAVGVHQFCRVGSLAMVGGLARVIQDVPPFVTVDGLTGRICGLNQIGLRRSGRTVEEIRILKDVYRLVFRSGLTWKEILKKLENNYSIGPGAEMTQFLAATKRGIVSERHSISHTPLRLLDAENNDKNDSDHENEIQTIRVNAG